MRARALCLALALVSCSDSSNESRKDVGDTGTGLDVVPFPDVSDASDTGDGAVDTAIDEDVEGGFGKPCLDNKDCLSGFCVETPEGSECTKVCTSECPEGWRCAGINTGGSDLAFVCTPLGNRLCQPCTVDAQCAGGYCLTDSAGQHACSRPCGDHDSCPNGYACQEATSETASDVTSKQCLPVTGLCDCTADNAGEQRPCPIENENGRCWGFETCDGELGWSTCDAATPMAEVCDGVDQNCNTVSDEGVTPPSEPCQVVNDLGTCGGHWSCAGVGGWVCDAKTPTAEVCNYQDDDCDGVTDDGFRDEATGLYVGDDNCGVCGSSCEGAIAFASATACDVVDGAAACVATACESGYFIPIQTRQACVPIGGGAQCSSCFGDLNCVDLPDGKCELLDGSYHCTAGCTGPDDCDAGYVCDGGRCVPPSGSCDCLASNQGNTRICRNANATGICFGTQVCDSQVGWSGCTAPTPMGEVCNGLDDDCDQAVDEDIVHDPARCEVVNDAGTCSSPWLCRGASGWQCEAATPASETCDYVDDDCDGQTDEGYRDQASGQYLDLQNCGACGISCVGALPNATAKCAIGPSGAPRCEVDSCDRGYFQRGPLACVPASADVCIPCASDAACSGGRCVTLSDGDFCLNPCETDANCTFGYTCQAWGNEKVCKPTTSSCRCDGSDLTLQRACSVDYQPQSGPSYDCFGVSRCTATGWGDCQLGGEECNLLDDDCDGLTDEDFLVDGRFATDENCGACGNDCTLLTFPGGAGTCNTLGSEPRCSLACTGNCFDVDVNPNNGCECCDPQPVDYPDPDGHDANCDGIDGEKDNAIFVAKWGSDAASGLWGAPKLTIAAGIAAAHTLHKRDVYVATGIYPAAFDLVLGVGVYGGYASDFAQRDGGLFETVVLGPDPTTQFPAAANAVSLHGGAVGGTVLDGFAIYGADVRTQGASSFAVRVVDCDASLRFSNNRVYAGSGGKGRRGLDGIDGADASSGAPGRAAFDVVEQNPTWGAHECSSHNLTSAGGAGGVATCGGVDTSGGAGGNRVCPGWDTANNTSLQPVASERGVAGKNGGATGGDPGWDVFQQRFSCEGYDTYGIVEGLDGHDGSFGNDGGAGLGCANANGAVVDGRWVAGTAGDGGTGTHGGGGGGGGSGAGAYVHDSCNAKGLNYDNFGGTGGGAGAGGCAGTAGTAGTSGGGAFGVLVVFVTPPTTVPAIEDNIISGGVGGDGGDGGNGGVGGSGGAGAFGGAGGGDYDPSATPPIVDADYPAFKGGKGGKGGNGGQGGGGGGGCGGPAFGIYVSGRGAVDVSAWGDDNAFPVLGSGGSGGLGGFSLGEQGGSGATGPAAATRF